MDVVVMGGGPSGAAAAMMLARDGHRVTLLEKDATPVPERGAESFGTWERTGVQQFLMPHFMHARFRHIIEQELPEVRGELGDTGLWYDQLAGAPVTAEEASSDPPGRWVTLTARRPAIDAAFGRAVDTDPCVDVRRGVSVEELLAGGSAATGVPHVTGVRTSDGDEIAADLVVDALGRRSRLPEWIEALGGRLPAEEAAQCGFTYYSRYYRGTLPEATAPLLQPYGTISVLTLPSEGGTWSVTLYTSTGDQPLKRLRDPEKHAAAVRACEGHAHWLDGEPITDIQAMAGIMDRFRTFAVDGQPVVTGIVSVGDSTCHTNPSLGRGLSLAMMHVKALRDEVRAGADDPVAFALRWHETTERGIAPWFQAQLEMDRARQAEIDALRAGEEPPVDEGGGIRRALFNAAGRDLEVRMGLLDIMTCMNPPQEVFARPGFFEKVLELGADADQPPGPKGPTRQELVELMA